MTPWTAACQAPLSFTISWSLLKFMSIESVMLSNHLILCHPFLLLPPIFPSIKVFSMSWPCASGGQSTGASASASILPMNIQDWFPLGWTGLTSLQTGLISLQSKGISSVFSSTTVQKQKFFCSQKNYGPTLTSIHDYWENHSFEYMDLCQQSGLWFLIHYLGLS